jgi:hypothetical protein
VGGFYSRRHEVGLRLRGSHDHFMDHVFLVFCGRQGFQSFLGSLFLFSSVVVGSISLCSFLVVGSLSLCSFPVVGSLSLFFSGCGN